jgi:hypothetical protein
LPATAECVFVELALVLDDFLVAVVVVTPLSLSPEEVVEVVYID